MKRLFIAVLMAEMLLFLMSCGDNDTDKSVTEELITVQETAVSHTELTTETEEIDYIVNMNTGKFHYPECPSVKQMKEENKWEYVGNREKLISQGYKPCKKCEP